MDQHGTVVQASEPEWRPLLALIGEDEVEWFMWMFEVELAGGPRLHAYKHRITRRYVHLTLSGEAYAYTARETYIPVPAFEAMTLALAGSSADG